MGNCVIINNNLSRILYYLANITNTIPSNRYVTNPMNQSCLDVFSFKSSKCETFKLESSIFIAKIFSNKKKSHRECKLGRTKQKYRDREKTDNKSKCIKNIVICKFISRSENPKLRVFENSICRRVWFLIVISESYIFRNPTTLDYLLDTQTSASFFNLLSSFVINKTDENNLSTENLDM